MATRQRVLSAKTQTKARSLLSQLKRCKDNIAKERDKMRELISEYEAIIDSTDEAHQDLERCVETLSQYL